MGTEKQDLWTQVDAKIMNRNDREKLDMQNAIAKSGAEHDPRLPQLLVRRARCRVARLALTFGRRRSFAGRVRPC